MTATRRRKSKQDPLFPSRVTIRGREWKIEVVEGLSERRGFDGYCQRWKRTILIDAGLGPRERRAALHHELLHAIWPQRVVSWRTEERLVERLEKRVGEVFWVRWI